MATILSRKTTPSITRIFLTTRKSYTKGDRCLKCIELGQFLAETGIEYARSLLQYSQNSWRLPDGSTLTAPAGWNSSQGGGNPALQMISGSNVNFVARDSSNMAVPSVDNVNAQGIAVTMPVYDAGGNKTGDQIIGYFSYIILGTNPIQIYALGAVGDTATNIRDTKIIHAIVKPVSYSDYTFFSGSSNKSVDILPTSKDFFLNTLLSQPHGSATDLVSGGSSIGNNGKLNGFNKTYIGGPLNIKTPTGNDFIGFSNGIYQLSSTNPTPVTMQNDTYFTSRDGLYTGLSGDNAVGLPNANPTTLGGDPATSQLNTLMTNYRTSGQGGAFVASDWTSTDNWVTKAPINGDYSSYNIDTIGDETSPQSLPSSRTVKLNDPVTLTLNGTTDRITVSKSVGTPFGYSENGASIPTTAPLTNQTIDLTTLNQPIIFVAGSVNIKQDPTSPSAIANGRKLTIVSTGKVTLKSSLKYTSYSSDLSDLSNPKFSASGSEMLGIITPHRIEIDPPTFSDADNIEINAVLAELGQPYTDSTLSAYTKTDDYHTIKLALSENGTYPYAPFAQHTTGKYVMFGTQIKHVHNGSYTDYYDEYYLPYDKRLLSDLPPFFAILSSGYNVVYWREVDKNGHDMQYH